jgi:hypothetical protein
MTDPILFDFQFLQRIAIELSQFPAARRLRRILQSFCAIIATQS